MKTDFTKHAALALSLALAVGAFMSCGDVAITDDMTTLATTADEAQETIKVDFGGAEFRVLNSISSGICALLLTPLSRTVSRLTTRFICAIGKLRRRLGSDSWRVCSRTTEIRKRKSLILPRTRLWRATISGML